MKTRIAMGLVALSTALALSACSSDNGGSKDGGGPINQQDSGSNPDGGAQPDSGGGDGGPNVCTNAASFDNKRVPGYPNPPQP